jgi:hypothetical protein
MVFPWHRCDAVQTRARPKLSISDESPTPPHGPLWVISGHVGLREEASALPLKAAFCEAAEIVSYVPIADTNHHLFSAVVIALIRLFARPASQVVAGVEPSLVWVFVM